MNIQHILERITGDAPAQKVFGAPIERDGVLVVPVATVRGAGGGGSGTGSVPGADRPAEGGGGSGGGSGTGTGTGSVPGADRPAEGGGGGFTFSARPVGVYVLRDGDAHWRPAVDVNRAILGGQLLGLVCVLAIRSVLRRRS